MAHRPLAPRATPGRFKAAFFGALTLGLLVSALPARGQTLPMPTGPATTPNPVPSTSPGAIPYPNQPVFPGMGTLASPSVVPMVPPSPGSTPTPPPPSPTPNGSPTPKPDKIQTRSDEVVNQRHEGIATLRGNVHVDYGNIKIDAEEINVDQNKHEIFTDTKFHLEQPDPKNPGQKQIVSGMGLRYNYDTDESTVYNANVQTPAETPGQQIYIRAKKIEGKGGDRFDATDAVFTTCSDLLDEKVPHYHVECRSLQYFAGDRIVAWDDKIYLNGKYTVWLPVAVIPLKKEGLNVDVGRNDIEGFYMRLNYGYSLPALNNGYLLNQGRLLGNIFEKKGLGLGVEHTINWGYAATTYGYFYGLASPDRSSFLPYNDTRQADQARDDQQVAIGEKLFGLYGGPFQDHQWGIEHRQRLFGNMEAGGHLSDDNIYDPITPNFRINRRIERADVKDNIAALGNLNYTLSYDSTEQRGTQTLSGTDAATQYNDSLSQRVTGNASFKVANTNVQVNNDFSRQHSSTVTFASPVPQPSASVDLNALKLDNRDGGGTDNLTTNVNLNSTWPGNVNSTMSLPYRLTVTETPAPSPVPSVPGASPIPTPSPSPWNQNIEPAVDVTTHINGVGNLDVAASKFFDLTQLPAASPLPIKQQVANIHSQGRWDRLPEINLTSDPFLAQWQPVSAKLGYGRFFESATFKAPTDFTGQLDRYFPGPYIDRLNPEITLGSKGQDIGLKSKLDFGSTGFRQYFYSTRDAQYSIDEHVRLTTDWTDKIQSNFNYTNNLTPDPKDYDGGGLHTPTNSSPFNQDKIATYKQTRLTADFGVHNPPWINYTLRSGYDYQNKVYDDITSEMSWFNTIPFIGTPFGLTLNGDFQPLKQDWGGLKFISKPLDVRYLPKVPLWGIDGSWRPVTGTFTLRSQPDVFGGAYGSDHIVPGWQFDNQLAYDFDKGLWQSLINRLYLTLGDRWQNHVELVLGGYYDTTPGNPGYRFSTFGINKDLHDFILSFQYDRIQSYYSLQLTMVAFPSQPLNFTSNTFNRLSSPGGPGAFPGLGVP